MKFYPLLFLGLSLHFCTRKPLSKTLKSILDLVDYERPPSVSMDTKEYMLLTYRDSYKTLDDLNQDEMRLGA
jgi:hypothetical protein